MSAYSVTEKKSKYTAATVAVTFHLLIFLMLWLNGFHNVIQQKEEGIEVMFGSVAEASGSSVPKPIYPSNPVEQVAFQPAAVKTVKSDQPLTQSVEDSYAMQEQKRKTKAVEDAKIKAEEQKHIAAEQLRQAEEQRRINEINSKTSGAFGRGAQTGSGNSTTGKGFQGSPSGNSTAGATTGSGGIGVVPSYSLDGRRQIGSLPLPAYTDQIEGTIVIEIVVTPEGKVIDADIVIPRTTISIRAMRDAARRAALQSRFNDINSKENQVGSITYVYRYSK
ncbi:MAG: cell envelope integrity protein TolA [Bacteroidales bacterium]